MIDIKDMTNQQLVTAFADNTSGADTELFERFYPLVKQSCSRYLNCQHDIQDAAQEVMINVIARKKVLGYRGEATIKNWLYRVSANMCKSYLRKKKQLQENYYEDWMAISDQEQFWQIYEKDTLHFLEKEEESRYIAKQVECLPEKYRKAVHITYLWDYSYKQAAKSLKITVNNLAIRLSRAKKMLIDISNISQDKMTPPTGTSAVTDMSLVCEEAMN